MSGPVNFGNSDEEATRSALVSYLHASSGRPQLGSSQEFIRVAEAALLTFLLAHTQLFIVGLSKGRLHSAIANELAADDGGRYFVAISEEPHQHRDLYLTCLAVTSPSLGRYKEVVVDLTQPSRFRNLGVVMAVELESMVDKVASRGKFILDAGFAWMADTIISLVDRDQIRVAEGLYTISKEIFPEKSVREQVWYATVGPVYGFRLITPEVTQAALQTLTSTTLDLPVDPIDLLAELLATRLPRELLLMDKAARVDQSIEMDIADAGYSRGVSRYPFVLKSLYGGSSLTMMPVLRADRFAVLALFPAGNILIRDRLIAHRQEFEQRARELSKEIIDAASLFEVVTNEDQDKRSGRAKNISHLLGESLDEIVSEHQEPVRRWRHLRFR